MATKIERKELNGTHSKLDQDSPRSSKTAHRLERYISLVPSVAFNAVLQASWSAVAVSFQAGLLNGGPTSLVWGMLASWIGSTAVAASLAEMASINSVVGAQYRWTALYTPRALGSPAFWSLLQGWLTLFAWIATLTQVAYLTGGIVMGIAIQCNPGFVPTLWQGTLTAWAVLVLPLLGSIFARRVLVLLELTAGAANIVFFFVIVIVLGVLAPKSPAEFVFATTLTGVSGWKSPGVQWCIGLLSAAFPLQGFDGVIHMSAEIRNAPLRVPQAMVLAPALNGLFAFCFIIVVLFTIGDVDAAINTPTLYPIIEVFNSATQSNAATAVLMAMIIYLGVMALFSTMTSVSRLTWAFARDRGLPFSDFFAQIHPTLKIPLNALLLDVTLSVLIILITLGNTTAFFAIVSLSTLSLFISYIIPLVFFLVAKLQNQAIPYGPFRFKNKGFGVAVNVFALCWALFITIFLPFPPEQPVTWANMNYAGPLMGVAILWGLIDWCVSGRRRWTAPVSRKDADEEEREEDGR